MKLWSDPIDYPEEVFAELDDELSSDRFLLVTGEPLGTEEEFYFHVDAKKKKILGWDNIPNRTGRPLVSRSLKKVLEDEAGDDIQSIPVILRTADGPVEGYALVNILTSVNALDLEASEYTLIPGTNEILGFRRVRYRGDECLGDSSLCFEKAYFSHILVSEELASSLAEKSFQGLLLLDPEKGVY